MPRYTDTDGPMTDQSKEVFAVIKVKGTKQSDGSFITPLNMYIRHGMIIRDLNTGFNWKLKVAIKEQTITDTLERATEPGMLFTKI